MSESKERPKTGDNTPIMITVCVAAILACLVGIQAIQALRNPVKQAENPVNPRPTVTPSPLPTVSPVVKPSPVVTSSPIAATFAPSPVPTSTAMPISGQLATPEGYWVQVLQPGEGYDSWNLRKVPQGDVIGLVTPGTRLFSDNRVYGRWLSVQCPPNTCQGWAWINTAGIREVPWKEGQQ